MLFIFIIYTATRPLEIYSNVTLNITARIVTTPKHAHTKFNRVRI